MKTKCLFIVILINVLLAGCGSSKFSSFDGQKALELPKSQILAEAEPRTRDWGEGTSFNLSFAKTYAEEQARAAFVRKLATMIESASAQSMGHATAFNTTEDISSTVGDQELEAKAFSTQVAEGTVKLATVINTDTYKTKDNQYHVFVCIEWMGSAEEMADELTNRYRAKVNQQISDEERAKMETRYEQFRKSVEGQLNRLRGE